MAEIHIGLSNDAIVGKTARDLFEASALRYVFHGRNPATLRQRPIDDLNRTAVGGFEDIVGNLSLRDVS